MSSNRIRARILEANSAEELAKAFVTSSKIQRVMDRRLFIMGGKALLIHQTMIDPKNAKKVKLKKPINDIYTRLINLMMVEYEPLLKVLKENDPGLLIMWDERSCRSCGSVKRKWAQKVLNTCPEVVEFLGGTPEAFDD